MKVTKEKTEGSQTFLTIEIEPAEVEESLEQAYKRLVRRTSVPGFRKGKAPRPILERHIGRERLFENALDKLIPQVYEKALKEQGIEPIAQPQIEVTQTEPVVFKAIVPLKPNVKLGDYHTLKIEPPTVAEITEAQVDQVVSEFRHQHADWEPIELRPADFGDLVLIDVEGSSEGKTLIDDKRVPYQLQRNLTVPVPGFADQLVGMKKDGVKEFKITLPAEYPAPNLAGKEVSFKVKVNDVSQEALPELDDRFVFMTNPNFKSVAEFRQHIADDLRRRAQERLDQKFEDKVVDAVVGMSEAEFPPVLVEDEINRILNQRFPKGQEEMDAYLKRINKTAEEFHQGLHPLAGSRVKHSLVLGQVAQEEKIEVTDAEIDAEIESVIVDYGEDKKDENRDILNSPQNRAAIRNGLLARKTIQRLAEIARRSVETETTVKASVGTVATKGSSKTETTAKGSAETVTEKPKKKEKKK